LVEVDRADAEGGEQVGVGLLVDVVAEFVELGLQGVALLA
jgi:hypothetical protein